MDKIKLFVVPHTHYDAEVFLTRDVTLKWGSEHILDALFLLDTDPDYRFVLDQRCYVEGFAQLHPEQAARLKAHVKSGRVEIAGGMHAMPDANLPSGESLVRQVLYGQRYYERDWGGRSTTGWMLDIFGHHPQMPQIMRKAGFDSYVFCRGLEQRDHAGFNWVGLDGSRVRAEWLPYHYCVLGVSPNTLPEFRAAIDAYVHDVMRGYVYNGNVLALAGLDLHTPNPNLPGLIRQYNTIQNKVEVVLATPREYLQAQASAKLPELSGDFNSLFTGCFSARILLKRRNRELETSLFNAEKLVAINWANAKKSKAAVDELEEAWEPVLFNQQHDLICGSHVDASYERACDRYKRAAKLVALNTERSLNALTDGIDTRGDGIPLVVVNTLAQARRDVARCTLGLAGERWHALALYDADGARVPLQLDGVLRHPDGSIKRADLLFIADVPSLGYATYFVREDSGASDAPGTDLRARGGGLPRVPGLFFGNHYPNDGWIGNEHFDLHIDVRTGAIRSLKLRASGWEAVAAHEHGFATVCRQEDRGDPWEYYGPLRGDVMSTDNRPDPVPGRGERRAIFSDEYGGQGRVTAGPVMAEYMMRGPLGDGEYVTRVRVYAGIGRVELETELVNQQPFVRYRNVFPLNLDAPRITHEIPFGAVERPNGEFPAQNWVDVSDGAHGLAVINKGIPGHGLIGNELSTSLMKCAKIVAYGAVGGYDPATKVDAGFEIGVRHRFEQALLPHTGDWRAQQLHHEGMAFNAPLIVRACARHDGPLPVRGSFVALEPANLALHAMFVDGRELVLRVAEAAGEPAQGKIELRWPIAAVNETNFVGDHSRRVRAARDSFRFNATPFEIKTFRVALDR